MGNVSTSPFNRLAVYGILTRFSDFAEEFKQASVVATDITPVTPSYIPSNLTLYGPPKTASESLTNWIQRD